MFNCEYPVSHLDPMTSESEFSMACPSMWTVELPLTFPLYASEAWQAMKQRELPLWGCPWTSGVLLQIAVVQANPEGWSGTKISEEGVRRDRIMLWFILENKLIPFTTVQVMKWLDHYGFRVKSNQDVEIWWYPRRYPLYSFQVDAMIKGTGTLVDFLFAYSPLFVTQVSDPDGKTDLLFSFVSKNKEEIAKKRCKRRPRVERVGRNRCLTMQMEDETSDDDSEEGKRVEPEPGSGSDGRTTMQAEEEVNLENEACMETMNCLSI